MDIRVVDVEYNDDDGYDVHAYLKVSEDTTEEEVEDYLYDHGNIEVYVNGFETLNVKNASKYKDYDFVTYVDEPDDSIFEGVARNFSDALIEEYTLDEDGYQFSIDDYKANGELKKQADEDSANIVALQKHNTARADYASADADLDAVIDQLKDTLGELPLEELRELYVKLGRKGLYPINKYYPIKSSSDRINLQRRNGMIDRITDTLLDFYFRQDREYQKVFSDLLEPYYPGLDAKLTTLLDARTKALQNLSSARGPAGLSMDAKARLRKLAREHDPENIY